MGKRLLIVSNRLPVKVMWKAEELKIQSSEGGLATGLGSACKGREFLWIGWPGAEIKEPEIRQQLDSQLKERHLSAIYLSQAEINDFYEGFSNETLWPLYHYFPSYTLYNNENWTSYVEVNRKFADAVVASAMPDDIIWIHDYHLALVPAMVLEKLPGATIGFFQHIPFPAFEIFRLLPWRKEILLGMLGADLVGFHTLDDAGHFVDSVSHLLDLDITSNHIILDDRLIQVDAFPMGIDYEKYQQLALNESTSRNITKLRKMVGQQKLMISVDRLDYTKGIPQRLRAFEYLLEHYPEFRENISFLQLVVPSRDHVPQYKVFKDEIDKMVSSINARFSTIGWTPIYYFYRAFPLNLLSAVYKTADIALVTPLRDGMNLVSKEFVASKTDKNGVLVLSEMADASKELLQAILVNPNDVVNMAEAMIRAIQLPEDEQKANMEQMQQVLAKFDIHHWVGLFTKTLLEVKSKQELQNTRQVTESLSTMILDRYEKATHRLIILDYDGTLVPFHHNILHAIPDEALKLLLHRLMADPVNKIAIISGRNYMHLENWFRDMPADFFAEHGAWHKSPGASWELTTNLRAEWKPAIRNIMEQFTEKTPGSSIEEKSFSLAWHYRSVSGEIGELRAKELCNNLKLFSPDHGLQVLCGKKVVEVKNIEINKGNSVKQLLKDQSYDFILAVGDDSTDEEMFRILPDQAITIKVAGRTSAAAYFVRSFKEVRMLLEKLAAVASAEAIEK